MRRISIDHRWRVDAVSELTLPLPASAVWGQMRDLERFLTIDPLHARAQLGPPPRAGSPVGAALTLCHRVLGIGPDRLGRVLRWEEGRGFAVSDLSRRGPRRGFPHICTYRVDPAGERTCRVSVGAKGRWTATWLPRWAAKAWLRWVLLGTEARLRSVLLRYSWWLRRQTPPLD